MKRLALLLLLMVLLNWSCQDFSFDERLKLPVVEMLPVSVDEDGATFTSVIHDIGSNFIVRAYFNWYPKGREFFIEDELYREDVVLNDQKEVTLKIDRDLLDGVTYIGRLVIELEEFRVYSNTVEFVSQGATNEPIQYAPPNGPSGVSFFSQYFLYQDEIYIVGRDGIAQLSTQDNQWLNVNIDPDRIYESAFQAQGNRIICAGENSSSSSEENGLWFCPDFENSCFRVSNAPFSRIGLGFSFIIDDICYVNQGSAMYSFNTQSFQGINTLTDIPFIPRNISTSVRHYGFSTGGKGYVLVGFEETENEQGPYFQQQLWSFDPVSGEWSQLSDYPGTGRVHFTTSTDNEQFIYVGLGAESRQNINPIDGDFWRYDVVNNQWSFIGYGFDRVSPGSNWNSTAINNLIPILLRSSSSNNSNIIYIDPEQITVQ
ncbi:MAG: hypothetical protein AAFO03_16355 [Bacteroidota bacterium]